jgi:hypothetical protein
MHQWQFPHCVGALDGKHVAMLPPPNTGSLYYNYKHFHSIVLLALVDADYKFIYVDIGSYGRIADGGLFNNSLLAQGLAQNSLAIPPTEVITPFGEIPYVIVADDAFALKPYLMKPFTQRQLTPEQRVFNYRLSRARRVVENAFGIMSQRFQIFNHPIPLSPDKVEMTTMTACCLHNFLLRDQNSSSTYTHQDASSLSADTTSMKSIGHQGSNNSSLNAVNVRHKLCNYFNSSIGSVSWQNDVD